MATTTTVTNIPTTARQSRPQHQTRPSSTPVIFQIRENCTANLGLCNTVPLRKGDMVRATSPLDLERSRLRSRSRSTPGAGGQTKTPQDAPHSAEAVEHRERMSEPAANAADRDRAVEESTSPGQQGKDKCFVIHLRTGLPVWVDLDELTYPNGVLVGPGRRRPEAPSQAS